ncbi:MAG: hypothetical protein R8M11_03140 [Gallionella sp.]
MTISQTVAWANLNCNYLFQINVLTKLLFMITDQEVISFFKNLASIPLDLTDAQIKKKNKQLSSRRGNGTFPADCSRHLQVFNNFNVIPEYCFDCYKVLISPRNVLELLKLMMVFDFDQYGLTIQNRRKCMVEERKDSSGAYKGFVYCKSVQEGNKVYKIIRDVVSEHISPHVDVSFKRGCSEYARSYPKFPRTKSGRKPNQAVMLHKKSWKDQEVLFDKHYSITERAIPPCPQDEIDFICGDGITSYTGVHVFCIQYWLRYAASIGDKSYLNLTGAELSPIPNLNRPPFIGNPDKLST